MMMVILNFTIIILVPIPWEPRLFSEIILEDNIFFVDSHFFVVKHFVKAVSHIKEILIVL